MRTNGVSYLRQGNRACDDFGDAMHIEAVAMALKEIATTAGRDGLAIREAALLGCSEEQISAAINGGMLSGIPLMSGTLQDMRAASLSNSIASQCFQGAYCG